MPNLYKYGSERRKVIPKKNKVDFCLSKIREGSIGRSSL